MNTKLIFLQLMVDGLGRFTARAVTKIYELDASTNATARWLAIYELMRTLVRNLPAAARNAAGSSEGALLEKLNAATGELGMTIPWNQLYDVISPHLASLADHVEPACGFNQLDPIEYDDAATHQRLPTYFPLPEEETDTTPAPTISMKAAREENAAGVAAVLEKQRAEIDAAQQKAAAKRMADEAARGSE